MTPATDDAPVSDRYARVRPHRFLQWLLPLLTAVTAGAAWLALDVQPVPFAVEIAIAASDGAMLQVFYDRGSGIRESDSATLPIRASREPVTYRFAIPEGRYRLFRIDPSDRPGTYTLTAMRVLRGSGGTIASVPLEEIRAAAQLTLDATAAAAIAHVPAGAPDPQLLYEPRSPIRVAATFQERVARVWPAWRWAAAAFVVTWSLGYLLRRPRKWFAETLDGAPHQSIAAVGLLAALVSVYPLLIGRSLVSPNNGGTAMAYAEPPFVYGSSDFDVEDARGTDVGSMMWGILPYSEIQRDALAAGELPLWNRYDAMGRPLWGQAQHYFLEPIHFASLVIPDAALRGDAVFVVARAVFAVGAGLAALVATGSPQAGLLVALLAPFVGYFSYRFNHQGYFSIVYTPWLLWSYFRCATKAGPALARATGLVCLFSVLQMVGASPKEGAGVWVVTHAIGMTTLVLTRASAAVRVRRVAITGAAVIASLLITAPHWLVFLDTLARVWSMYDEPKVYVLSWRHIPAAMTLGALLPGRPLPSVNGLIAVLALTAFAAPVRLWSHRAAFVCVAAAALALALACGLLPPPLILEIPLLRNVYELWNVFMTASIVPLLIVAGAGAAALRETPGAGVIGALVSAAFLWLTINAGFPPHTDGVLALELAALGPAVAFVVMSTLATFRRPSASAVLLSGATFAAAIFPQGLHVETRSEWLNAWLFQPRLRVALDLQPPAIVVARERAGSQPFRVVGIEHVFFPGTQTYYRIEGLGGPDVLQLREEIELFDAGHIARESWRSIVRPENLIISRGLLDMLGVRFVLSRAPFLPSNVPRLRLPEPDLLSIFERPTAWPRAFFVDGVRRHHSVQAFAASLEAATEPFASIGARDERAHAQVGSLLQHETRWVAARGYRLTPNRTSFVIDAPGPGIAVLGEAFEPLDFIATLNGDSVEYFQVNHAFKGVAIPAAGLWTIEFTYRPRLFVPSLAIAFVGAVGVGLMVTHRRRDVQSRRVDAPPDAVVD